MSRERDANDHDTLVAHAEATAKRVHIATLDEIGEWYGTFGLEEIKVHRERAEQYVALLREPFCYAAVGKGTGETPLDALEAAFLDLAENHRAASRKLREREARAAGAPAVTRLYRVYCDGVSVTMGLDECLAFVPAGHRDWIARMPERGEARIGRDFEVVRTDCASPRQVYAKRDCTRCSHGQTKWGHTCTSCQGRGFFRVSKEAA